MGDPAGWDHHIGMGFGEEWDFAGEWQDATEIDLDLYSMVFALGKGLEPQDIYEGFEMDEKTLIFELNDSDVEETAPGSVRPLKIHPEPSPGSGPPQLTPVRAEASTPAHMSSPRHRAGSVDDP